MTGSTSARTTATPPMGWNSFDGFGSSVTEAQVLANLDAFVEHLKPAGYDTVVVDFCWSHPDPGTTENPSQDASLRPRLAMDGVARLLPAVARFPSAAGGAGFAPLAEKIHAAGLRFGLHIMRGIPRQAVAEDAPIEGTDATASQVARPGADCTWLNHMVGVDGSSPAGRAYYASLFRLYASWGVDFIKADDVLMSERDGYQAAELEAMRAGMDACGRPMVLSLSPGRAPLHRAEHTAEHADMWRVSADFWDRWDDLKNMFELCNAWSPRVGCATPRGRGWPDADMIPLGRLSVNGPQPEPRTSRFTADEARTLMTLWCVFRSPLMVGGHLPETDADTLGLLTHAGLLRIHRAGERPRQAHHQGGAVIWISDAPGGGRFAALFNLSDEPLQVCASWGQLELDGPPAAITDAWSGEDVAVEAALTRELAPHASAVFELR
ncbi:glycoside hydrolase family 27 protein [Phycisphaera mikurensis]|uniref:Alpha-galactosidase n=1 Tax=Phycisphaera mikurensis (strain NBRC 102666 / KCTC 22515 / FYK2301M01) TaxID=1142394 RepID=I0ICN7_PHYMF|nr:glycoside hydrolase family 27 protein [Phycisphaera mikurensis]MBB6442100.1 hypothetical protein [Phycisphaera mikurensis]BAM03025.1 putative glycoside hydrolase [Phycisphaera mikurensis NBRC 102666]